MLPAPYAPLWAGADLVSRNLKPTLLAGDFFAAPGTWKAQARAKLEAQRAEAALLPAPGQDGTWMAVLSHGMTFHYYLWGSQG